MSSVHLLRTPTPCTHDVYLVTFIHSALGHVNRRNVIRSTWARRNIIRRRRIKVVFILGTTSSENSHLEQALDEEVVRYNDMVQFDFVDSYRNLTFKHILGLRWVVENCPRAPYMMKTDDDVIVKIHDVITFAEDHQSLFQGFYCRMLHSWPIKRNILDPYYMPANILNGTVFPPFCMGYAYLLKTKWLPRLLAESRHAPFIWIDDAFVTGVLADRAGVSRTHRFDPHGFRIPMEPLGPWHYGDFRVNKTVVLLKEKYVGDVEKAMIDTWNIMINGTLG